MSASPGTLCLRISPFAGDVEFLDVRLQQRILVTVRAATALCTFGGYLPHGIEHRA
jgi:hypothetical protein